MRDLDTLVLIGAGIFAVIYVLPLFGRPGLILPSEEWPMP